LVLPCPRRIRAVRGGATVLDTLPTSQTFESGPFAGLAHLAWGSVDAIRSSPHIRVERPRTKFSADDS